MLALFSYISWSSIALLVLLSWLTKLLLRRPGKRLPPGVHGFAAVKLVLGCLRNGFERETSWLMRRLDSDVVSIDLFGLKTWIVFGTEEKLVEAYQKKGDYLLSRAINPLKPETDGLVSGTGPVWKEQRRFALHTLRDQGMGKAPIEQRIQDEIRLVLDGFSRTEGRPFNTITIVGTAIINIISMVIFSSRFRHEDPDSELILSTFNGYINGRHVRPMVTLSMFESFYSLPVVRKKIAQLREKIMMVNDVIKGRIERTVEDGTNGDYVDAFMKEMKKRENDATSTFTQTQLIAAVNDLFGAGSETTGTSLRWAVLYMVLYPDVQQRVYDELHEQFCDGRLPSYADRERTPYTEAVLLEIQRYASLIPMIRRQNETPVDVFGYTIDSGTFFIANLWHMNRDPAVWQRADEFYPEHFYHDGAVVNREKLHPFGLGKRQCLGESLAKMELYLFFTSILRSFRLEAPPGVELPNPETDALVGLVRSPPNFEICAVERDS